MGKAFEILVKPRLLTSFLAENDFVVNEIQDGVGICADGRFALKIRFDEEPLATPPAAALIFQQFRQGRLGLLPTAARIRAPKSPMAG